MTKSDASEASFERKLIDPPEEARRDPGQAVARLIQIMAILRSPEGCPWDRAQSLQSLKPFLIEEAYELIEAIDEGDPAHHREELGDVLLQVVFQTEIQRGEGRFDLASVMSELSDKLVFRHPHVFGDLKLESEAALHVMWEAKKQAKRPRTSLMAGIPKGLPALMEAEKLGRRAARVGFDWPEVSGPLRKLEEEKAELLEAMASGDRAAIEAELGDLLLTVTSVARALKVSSEEALRGANRRFKARFEHMEAALEGTGKPLETLSLAELDALWERAKISACFQASHSTKDEPQLQSPAQADEPPRRRGAQEPE